MRFFSKLKKRSNRLEAIARLGRYFICLCTYLYSILLQGSLLFYIYVPVLGVKSFAHIILWNSLFFFFFLSSWGHYYDLIMGIDGYPLLFVDTYNERTFPLYHHPSAFVCSSYLGPPVFITGLFYILFWRLYLNGCLFCYFFLLLVFYTGFFFFFFFELFLFP